MDEAILDRLLEGMEAISMLIQDVEDNCDEPERLLGHLQAVAKRIQDINGLAEQLIEQIEAK